MESKKVVTFCNQCDGDTNQTILYNKKVTSVFESDDDRQPSTKEHKAYMVIQCQGCNCISFLLRQSGDLYESDDNAQGYIDYNYPEDEIYGDIKLLSYEDQESLPPKLADLYQEVASAFQSNSNKLAGVGLRMLVEAICIEQNITGQNLKIKIEGLQAKGLVSKNETPILDKLREVGNASAHGIKQFPLNKLQYALEILNHVLKSIYILPKINKKLKL